jgi:polysaccharide deacetylase 2 family uncharacterized protein YibQ
MVRRQRSKKSGLSPIIIGLGLVAAILAILIGYLWRLDKKASSLPFEEIYATSRQLSADIRLVDKALAKGLGEMGVAQERISFLSVVPRHKDGYHWDVHAISVRIPKWYSLSRVGGEIRGKISQIRRPIEVALVKQSAKEIVYHIYCNGLLTHRLSILGDDIATPRRSPCPKVGIIIDDLGHDRALANAFMELKLPLTFSFLPFAPASRSIAHKAKQDGREVMLHLPMEPISYPAVNPGDGVLLVSMDEDMILDVLDRDLSQVPFASGVNNHMGSRFTQREEKMIIVLNELKRRGLYFVDSRTSSESVAFKVARRIALRTAKRDIFLDNELSENALKIQMERLLSLAKHRGCAIGIGHPHRETLEFLKGYLPTLGNDTEVVPVCNLVN